MPRSQAILEIVLRARDDSGKIISRATMHLGDLGDEVTEAGEAGEKASKKFGLLDGAILGLGMKAANFVTQLPAMAWEMAELGAQAEAVEHRFTQFAGGTGAARKYLIAFQEATDGTASTMEAMGGAAKLLQMGLVGNAEEMRTVAAIATKLGDQTASAGNRIADFAMMLANQSIPRLDNFGISSGTVRQRIDELLKSGEALNREEAFKMAVMEEGGKALETLGDTSDLTKVKMDQLTAALSDLKTMTAENIAEQTKGIVAMAADVAQRQVQVMQLKRMEDELIALNLVQEEEAWTRKKAIDNLKRHSLAYEGTTKVTKTAAEAMEEYNKILDEHESRVMESTNATANWEEALDEYAMMVSLSTSATVKLTDEQKEATFALSDARASLLEYTEGSKDWIRTQVEAAETAEALAWEEEQLQAGLQAAALSVTALTEEEKVLALQQEALAVSTAAFALDMTMSWKDYFDATEVRSQEWVTSREELEAEHTAKMAELQAEGNAAAIAEEEARYEEELTMLATNRALQEEEQRASLGRMVLQSFEAWAQMKQIPADKMLEMRTAIAEEYDLIDAETAAVTNAMVGSWESWADGFDTSAASVMGDMAAASASARIMADVLNAIPRDITVNVHVNAPQGVGWSPNLQHGTTFFGGGLALVGERGPELVALPRGARVWSNAESRRMANVPTGLGEGGGRTVIVQIENNFAPGSVRSDDDIAWITREQERMLVLRGARMLEI